MVTSPCRQLTFHSLESSYGSSSSSFVPLLLPLPASLPPSGSSIAPFLPPRKLGSQDDAPFCAEDGCEAREEKVWMCLRKSVGVPGRSEGLWGT